MVDLTSLKYQVIYTAPPSPPPPIALFYQTIFTFQVGKDKVRTALTLVGFKGDLEMAMKFVFGSTLVCDQMEQAKKVMWCIEFPLCSILL